MNDFGRHLGRHLVSKNLSNDEMTHIIYFHNLLTIKEQFRKKYECYMGPFYVNNAFGRHLGCHLVSNKLSNVKMVRMI